MVPFPDNCEIRSAHWFHKGDINKKFARNHRGERFSARNGRGEQFA